MATTITERELAQCDRLAMRQFAARGTLDVWYARMDVDDQVRRWSREASASQRKQVDKFVAKARSTDSTRAMAKLTHVSTASHGSSATRRLSCLWRTS